LVLIFFKKSKINFLIEENIEKIFLKLIFDHFSKFVLKSSERKKAKSKSATGSLTKIL
jgi:hypothetical protein